MKISPAQAQWFRFRRSGLAAPFDSPEEAAHSLAGVQSQDFFAAGLSVWNRAPSLDLQEFQQLVFGTRSLIRFWGQRNTLHLYSISDWPLFHAALQDRIGWFERGFLKRGGDPRRFEAALQKAADRLRRAESLCRDDVRDLEIDLEELSQQYWSGLFMSLERRGLACHAEQGPRNEIRFAHREVWAPELKWSPPLQSEATTELTRRYFRTYGPASAADLGFWWGTPAGQARRMIEPLREEMTEVDLEGQMLLILREDLAELTEAPLPPHRWPVRLLARFDPMLLGLRDKSWLISEQHYKQVWGVAGQVAAVLLVKGRIAGTWRLNRLARGVEVTADPFAELSRTVRASLEKQAQGVARFFGQSLAEFRLA